jgi:hypothetical protein
VLAPNGATNSPQFVEWCVVLGFGMENTQRLGSVTQRCVLVSRDNKLLGKNFQEVYFSQFLAKPGAGRAQLGVFGHSGAIGAIYFAF